MRRRISSRIKKFLIRTSSGPDRSQGPTRIDVREEYANAFRTESYVDFWNHVLSLAKKQATIQFPVESTTANRLPSYRLFAEHLLDPDPPTVFRILDSAHNEPIYNSLLHDYFAQTANASLLCGLLLKQIDRTRVKHNHLKDILENPKQFPTEKLLDNPNPFMQVRTIQEGCSALTKQFELRRDKVTAKVKRTNEIVRSSAMFIVVLAASLTLIVLAHGVIVLAAAAPGLAVTLFEPASSKKLARVAAQLDAAAKGTYTLNRDLDTIGRLVARVNHELEHMRVVIRFWVERREGRCGGVGEVARELKMSYASFSQQLNELEEHLYLCFMTINRARNLVLHQISYPDPTH